MTEDPMRRSDDPTLDLLGRWHAGDRAALDELLAQEGDWVTAQVRRRLGGRLREKAQSLDIVQEAMLEVLRYVPRFQVRDRRRFRSLLAKIVENVLRDQDEFYRARRRAMSREEPENSVLRLDGLSAGRTSPDAAAERREEKEWLRLALELMDAEDREVILLKQWDELSYPEIAQRLGIGESAARMRFQRAMPKLAQKVKSLKSGAYLDGLGDPD